MMLAGDHPNPALPPLREDLRVLPGHSDWTGEPTFLIHDPLRNRYFRVGKRAFDLLSVWRAVSVEKLAGNVEAATGEPIRADEVEEFAKFLLANGLVQIRQQDNWKDLAAQAEASRRPMWQQVVHNYLFFRVPLFRPQWLLNLAWPLVAPLFTRSFAICMAVMAVFALYLVARQWDVFLATFASFLTLEGFMLYAASLVFIKIIHELGHAFMAKKYSVEVPVIGVAFIVLMPILYTDTTGAYRLRKRRQKLNIDLAGIYAELVLAVMATLAWVFLPDGALRSIAFSTATLSWVLSLAINLNPFMRFDGYYVLSDMIGFENLQERGFALAKWRLRETLFGLKRPPPEFLPAQWRTGIILHAWGTWIYRFFLFIGIALLVYHFFIKIIGIAFFIIEICWFILLPIWREIKNWWNDREEIIMHRRSKISLCIFLALIALFVTPWFGEVKLPAFARVTGIVAIHAPDSGQVLSVGLQNEMRVREGQVLVQMASPELDVRVEKNRAETDIVQLRLARMTADREEQSLRLVLEQELASKRAEAQGLNRLNEQLIVRAATDGRLANADEDLHEGVWINPAKRLAVLVPDAPLDILALIPESAVARLRDSARGTFIPDDPALAEFEVRLEKTGEAALPFLPDPVFADIHGGAVPVLPQSEDQGNLVPRGAWYPVHLRPLGNVTQAHRMALMRGVVRLEADRQSMAERVFKRVASVLLRESGF